MGVCTSDGYAVKFKQEDLTSLNISTDANNPIFKASPTGCGAKLSPAKSCEGNGRFDFPRNGEYQIIDTNISNLPFGACNLCTLDYGCSCGSKGSILGSKCAIQRTSFKGDDGVCCLKGGAGQLTGIAKGTDKDWTKYNENTYTCDTNIMDPYGINGGINCPQRAEDVCVGSIYQTGPLWKRGGPCYEWIRNSGGNAQAIAPVLRGALRTYTNTWGVDLSGDAYKMHREHLENLLTLCETYPGVCSEKLDDLCIYHKAKGFGPQKPMTRGDVATAYANFNSSNNNRNIVTACGCHLPESEYKEYTDAGIDIGSTNACDPICKLPGALPKYFNTLENNWQKGVCSQSLCVIDDVTINLINSNVGNIDFNVTCSGCSADGSGGSCMCIFSDINVLSQASNISGINFNVDCGGNCYMADPITGIADKKIDCPGSNIIPSSGNKIWEWIKSHYIEIGVGIIVLVILIIIFVASGRQQTPNNKSIDVPIKVNNYGNVGDYYPK